MKTCICKLQGGPLDGKRIRVHSSGTLIFSLHGFKGRYNLDNKWEDVA